MVETPGGRPNLGGLENHVLRGVCCEEEFRGGKRRETKTFGGSAQFGVAPVGKEPEQKENTPTMYHQMLDSLEGYLDNIASAATVTPLAELADSLIISVYTVARQQIEIK